MLQHTMPYQRRTYRPRRPTTLRKKPATSSGYTPKRRYMRSSIPRRAIRRTARVGRMLSGVSELKLSGVTPQREVSGAAINTLAVNTYYKAFCTSPSQPASWTGTWTPVDGFSFPQGVGGTNRTGEYGYLKKTHLTLGIDTNASGSGRPISMQFRVIAFKQNRKFNVTGISPDPIGQSTGIFLNETGAAFGSGSSATGTMMQGFDVLNRPLNKRDFYFFCDKKFTLHQDHDPSGGPNISSPYPSHKEMNINLYHNRKARFATDHPSDYDYVYGLLIYARPIGQDSPAENWECSLLGTTSMLDS